MRAHDGRCWWYRCDRFPISLHSTLSQSCYTRQRKLIPFFSFIRHPLYRFHSTGIYMAEEVMHLVFSPRLKKNWMCHFGYLLHSIFAQVSRESFCRVLFILYSRAELVPSFISHTRRAAVTKWKVLHSLFSLFACAHWWRDWSHTGLCTKKHENYTYFSLSLELSDDGDAWDGSRHMETTVAAQWATFHLVKFPQHGSRVIWSSRTQNKYDNNSIRWQTNSEWADTAKN